MDWEATQGPGEVPPSLAAAGSRNGEELAAMDIKAAFESMPSSRRPPGRRISHRKNPSDTFAFAAGQLFQHTPQDFYNLLDTPLETSDSLQGLQHAVGAEKVPISPHTSFGGSLQQAASAGLESAAEQHTLGDSQLAHDTTAATSISPQAAAATPRERSTISLEQPTAAADAHAPSAEAAAAADGGSEDAQMSADSDPEELPDSDHKSRKGRGQRKQQQNAAQTRANALDPATLDPRRAKRILANRQSAQRSRMKRLQYIHDLENRSAATSATVKEIQAEVQRLQEQHTGLAEAVEQRKAQVDTLTCQLLQEKSLKATLVSHISALQSQLAWQQQQQQQAQLPSHPLHQQAEHTVQQQQHRQPQRRQQQSPVKQEPYYSSYPQQPEHVEQHGYMANHRGSFDQHQQQHQQQAGSTQQQHSFPEQQQHHGVPYPQYHGGQPPVQQMHAMDLGHATAEPGLGQGCYHHHQQQHQQQHALPGVPVKQDLQDLHQQQQQQRPSGPHSTNSSNRDPAAAAATPQHQAAAVAALNTGDTGQQYSDLGAAAAAAGPIPMATGFPTNNMLLHQSPSPSPCKLERPGIDYNTHSPSNLGLAGSLGPGMSDGVTEADLEGLLQDQTYLVSGLTPGASGGLTTGFSGCLSGNLSGALGIGSVLGSGPLRLTPSLELPSDMVDSLGHGRFGTNGGLGFNGLGSSGYAVRQEGLGGVHAGSSDADLRKTLSM